MMSLEEIQKVNQAHLDAMLFLDQLRDKMVEVNIMANDLNHRLKVLKETLEAKE